ncbi:hypothetical protein pdam_00010464, partial [Pocillopora damicornis]
MTSNTVLIGAAVCSSLAVGYLLGKLHGSCRYADDYIQRPGREYKKTAGLKTFLEYVAKYSSAEHHTVTELRRWREEKSRGKDERISWLERQMMLATRIIHIYRVFLYATFQRIISIKGPVPIPNTIVRHSFRLAFRKRRMVIPLLLFIPLARDVICEKLEEFSPKATEADQTSFITQLAKAIGARKVLEVGTFAGTTSLSIALVLPEDGQM